MCLNNIIFIYYILLLIHFYKNITYYKSVILIRASSPSSSQIERYIEWKKLAPHNYYVVLLTDKCNIIIKNISITCIKPSIMLNIYPEIKNILGPCKSRNDIYYMWALPFEHIIIWINLTSISFKYLWIVEQDLSYSGNIFSFFSKYDYYKNDLIILSYCKLDNKTKWLWKDCCTREYKDWVKLASFNKRRLASPTFLTRWSKIFINFMTKNMKMKRHAFSESSAIECAYFNNLSIRRIERNHIGYKCRSNSRITKKEWTKIITNSNTKNKFFHALKF